MASPTIRDRTPVAPPEECRGLLAKRRAILDAAIVVFVREGYTRAGVDVIASEAGLSKQTIYNHFGDKERLFLATVEETLKPLSAEVDAIVNATLRQNADIETDLLAFGRQWLPTITRPDVSALYRLIIAESPHFPALRSSWREAAADPAAHHLGYYLACHSNNGKLAIPDPARAGRQLLALMSSEAHEHSVFGTVELDAGQLEEIVVAAVDMFLRAYSPSHASAAPQR
ncbi:TetR/AcrR family transcriptional regulator [Amycolatopsis sp. lyj-23]|uniref:TetR/AcrR family transcriptional regulator n=1 Tax=Amycolatopsis sp. lyj-23 TaxID=2789283 RepID=UPI0039791972